MGFANSIIGGAATLIRAAVQSANFITGVSGWRVTKDGNAEFNNITIRGTFGGTDFVVNANGMFFYSPSEASGNLVLAIAPVATAGPFGESVDAGIGVGKSSDAAQVQLVPSPGGQSAFVRFPVPSLALSNVPNVAAGVVTGTPNYSDMLFSGPALSTAGLKDWGQISFFSNNGAGIPAHVEFRYISNAGVVTVVATFTGTDWEFFQPVVMDSTLQVDGAFSSDAGVVFTDGSGNLTIGNGFTLTPKMATPPNTAAVKAGTATLAQTEVCLGALIQSMQNRGMVS
jgi:hypothetical protein